MDLADIYEAESTGVSNSLHVEVRERPEPTKISDLDSLVPVCLECL